MEIAQAERNKVILNSFIDWFGNDKLDKTKKKKIALAALIAILLNKDITLEKFKSGIRKNLIQIENLDEILNKLNLTKELGVVANISDIAENDVEKLSLWLMEKLEKTVYPRFNVEAKINVPFGINSFSDSITIRGDMVRHDTDVKKIEILSEFKEYLSSAQLTLDKEVNNETTA